MKPSIALAKHAQDIRAAVSRHHLLNARVFGSTARGQDAPGSDLDILVDTLPETSLFDIIHLEDELQEMLGIKVDVVSSNALHRVIRDRVFAECRTI